ncbi:HTH domain-containing protein [Clavibacter zhangzhiyongii]|uniref:HTH domain-containing protein n=1 Tax=Clavibacter zhangzhiyongii TaxID=2768071 RepID=UPI0039E0124B
MLSENQERLLDYLSTADRWVEAGELADRLGVTTRSVRNYVTAVRERSAVEIASSPTATASTPAATPATSAPGPRRIRRAPRATACTPSSAASATRPTASTSSRSRPSCT